MSYLKIIAKASVLFAFSQALATPMDNVSNIQQALKENPKILDTAIARYIDKHPEKIWNAVIKYQQQQQEQQQQASLKHLKSHFKESFYNQADGSIGQANAPISIMVLSDRQCGYCKKAWKSLSDLVAEKSEVRVAFKEMPILGAGSTQAARFAIWAQQHGMFHRIDKALVEASTPLDLNKLKRIAVDAGLPESSVDEAQTSKDVTQVLEKNFMLAQKIGLQGTPMLFIANAKGSKIVPLNDFMNQEALGRAVQSMQK